MHVDTSACIHVLEDMVLLTEIEKFGHGHVFAAETLLAGLIKGKADHAVVMRVREGVDEYTVDSAENYGDRADAQCKREDSKKREAPVPIETADCEAKILK